MQYFILGAVWLFFSNVVNGQFRSQIDCFVPATWEGKESKLIIQPLNHSLIIDTAIVSNRHAVFTVDVPDVSAAYIWFENTAKDIHLLIDVPQLSIAIDPQAAVPLIFSGTTSSERWRQQQESFEELNESIRELRMEWLNPNLPSDSLLLLARHTDSLQLVYQQAVTGLIRQSISAPASWYLFASTYRMLPYKQARQLFSELSGFSTFPSYTLIEQDLARKRPGQQLPNFSLPTLSGKMISLSAIENPYILLDFSVPEQISYRWRHAQLKKLYQQYHALGLEILTVAQLFNKTTDQPALQAESLPWVVALDDMTTTNLAHTYFVDQFPSIVLITNEHTLIGRDLSMQELEDLLATLLK